MTSALPPPPARPAAPARRWSPWIWVGLAMVVVGGVGSVVWSVASIPGLQDDIDDMQRAAPGEPLTFEVAEPVAWELFLEPGGRSQSGLRYAVYDEAGAAVDLLPGGGTSYDWTGRSGRSIASVDLAPGTYRLEVDGDDATIAIGDGPGDAMRRLFVGAALIGAPLILAGLAVAIVAAIRDTRRRTQQAEPAPPSPWSAGEWPAEPGR